MKMVWGMQRERMTDGLTTYIFCFFVSLYYNYYLNEMFCGLERCWNELGGGRVT